MGLLHIAPWALQNLGHALLRRGELQEARAAVARALEAGTAQGDARLAGGSRIYLAMIAAAAGDAEASRREAATAAEELSPVPSMRAGALAALGRSLLALRDPARALASVREAMSLLESLGSAGMGELEAFVRLALVEALVAAGDREEAASALATARERLMVRAARILDHRLRESFLSRVPENARTLALADSTHPG